MSFPKNQGYVGKIDADTFLEFLGAYHEAKWEANDWYDIEATIDFNKNLFKLSNEDYDAKYITKFKKYLNYQYSQYCGGKSEIRLAYELYIKIYNKKTRNISTQTEVSLSPNKKYFTNKC